MSRILRPFGRYFLLDQIAQGGMAEIYRARFGLPGAGSRILVIKCPQQSLDPQSDARRMFETEGRIQLGLHHPHIVQLQDFGEAEFRSKDGGAGIRPYLSLEYVPGLSLRSIQKSLGDHGGTPLAVAIRIAITCARALHFAHEQKDPSTGAPLEIVHRDVNPRNILISWKGDVKLIDFGIAKASGETTQPGAIKGTPAYLSPEQVRARPDLDRRSDVFSLGIVLWEMLTGKRLFFAQDESLSLRLIDQSDEHVTPPSAHRPGIPPTLDRVVLQALTQRPEERIPSADAFAEDLEWALGRMLAADPALESMQHPQQLMEAHFREARAAAESELMVLNNEAERLIREGRTEPVVTETRSFTLTEPESEPKAALPADTASIRLEDPNPDSVSQPEVRPQLKPEVLPRPQKRVAPLKGQRPLPKKPPSSGGFRDTLLFLGFLATLIVLVIDQQFPELAPWQIPDAGSSLQPLPLPLATLPSPEPSLGPESRRFIRLSVTPPVKGGLIRYHGKFIPPALVSEMLPDFPEGPIEIVIQKPGYRIWTRTFRSADLPKGPDGIPVLQADLSADRPGFLNVETTLSGRAHLEVDGNAWPMELPIRNLRIAPGTYVLHIFRNIGGAPLSIRFTIQESRITQINEAVIQRAARR